MLSDKAEMFPSSRYGSYSEPASNPSHGWSIPPRISSYSVSASRSSVENPISPATGGVLTWNFDFQFLGSFLENYIQYSVLLTL